MQYFRESNIIELSEVLCEDDFDDSAQRKNFDIKQTPHFDFVKRNIKPKNVLEIGCGNGDLFDFLPITHAIEPCKKRYINAKDTKYEGKHDVIIEQAFCECIPNSFPLMDTIIFIDGFFQVRSDYEALIEINRFLNTRGRFIFNFISSDNLDIIVGRVLKINNILRMLGDFGFGSVLEQRTKLLGYARFPIPVEFTYLCVEKTRDFDKRFLKKPFFVEERGLYKSFNIVNERDWYLF